MAWCLLAAGFCFYMPDASSAKVPLIAFFIYLFTAFYGPGMRHSFAQSYGYSLTIGAGIGPIPSIYFSESFPLSHREIGAAFTICVNNAVGSALSLTFPKLLAKITPTGAFGFYAALNMIAFVVIFFIVPETKKRKFQVTGSMLTCRLTGPQVPWRSLTTSSESLPLSMLPIRSGSGYHGFAGVGSCGSETLHCHPCISMLPICESVLQGTLDCQHYIATQYWFHIILIVSSL